MDTNERETRDVMGDLGGNDAVIVSEYDLAESPGPEMSAGTPLREGDETGEGSRAVFAASAEGQRIDIRGAVAVARGEQATVKGLSVVTMGRTTKVKGLAPVAVAAETVKLKKAGSLLAVAGNELDVGERGFVGFALAPKVEVREGGKVLIGLVSAIAAGLAFGLGLGLSGMLGVRMVRRMWMSRRH